MAHIERPGHHSWVIGQDCVIGHRKITGVGVTHNPAVAVGSTSGVIDQREMAVGYSRAEIRTAPGVSPDSARADQAGRRRVVNSLGS